MTNKKVSITFTLEDINNLVVFLNRTDLKGEEVKAYNSIMFNVNNCIRNVEEEERLNEIKRFQEANKPKETPNPVKKPPEPVPPENKQKQE